MKAILITLLLIATNLQAQSAYNANTKFSKSDTLGAWYITPDGGEVIFQEVTTVGVFKAYTELNKVLNYYQLDFNKPILDQTYLSKLVKDYEDFPSISFTAKMKETIISKAWTTNEHIIIYLVDDNAASVAITKK